MSITTGSGGILGEEALEVRTAGSMAMAAPLPVGVGWSGAGTRGLLDSRRTVSHRRPGSAERSLVMARKRKTGELSKQTAAQALGAAGAAFGFVSVVAPRAIAGAYGVPVTDAGLQLQRLFGSRALVVSALALTAKTDEEADRGLAAVAAMNLLDSVTALATAKKAGTRTTVTAVVSSLAYGAAALAVRALKD